MGYHRWDNSTYGKSDFSWGYFGEHGWAVPHVVTYMESHDEERMMFKNLTYGKSSDEYSTKDLPVAPLQIDPVEGDPELLARLGAHSPPPNPPRGATPKPA